MQFLSLTETLMVKMLLDVVDNDDYGVVIACLLSSLRSAKCGLFAVHALLYSFSALTLLAAGRASGR